MVTYPDLNLPGPGFLLLVIHAQSLGLVGTFFRITPSTSGRGFDIQAIHAQSLGLPARFSELRPVRVGAVSIFKLFAPSHRAC